jgi:hypothetical protein
MIEEAKQEILQSIEEEHHIVPIFSLISVRSILIAYACSNNDINRLFISSGLSPFSISFTVLLLSLNLQIFLLSLNFQILLLSLNLQILLLVR